MPYSANEQQLYDHLKASLPIWFFQNSASPEELWGAYVKLFDATRTQVDTWRAMSMIGTATGIWLDQHAVDRGTSRQDSETDADLRERIRVPEDAVTLPSLKAHVQAMMDAAGIPSPLVGFVELRRDKAFMNDAGAGNAMAFFGRGYRFGSVGRIMQIIVMLPYGTTASTRAAVSEYIRIHKAAGYSYSVEVRAVP